MRRLDPVLYAFYLHGYGTAARGRATRPIVKEAIARAPTPAEALRRFLAASFGAADGRVGVPRAERSKLGVRVDRVVHALGRGAPTLRLQYRA